jgi:ER membrane protein SH3
MPTFAFATFLIVCRRSHLLEPSPQHPTALRRTNYLVLATAFFLGILFSLFPYDYPLLWASGSATQEHLLQTEAHLRLLHASPALIVRILHTMIFLGLLGLITKLYKPSESNMLFDGGSLVLYMCGIVVYVANIVKGLRIVTLGIYGKIPVVDADGGVVKDDGKETVVGREDNLKVLSASNTILALVLVGVLILQAGQWYAERADERERVNIRKEEEKEKDRVREESEERSGLGVGVGVEVPAGEAVRRKGRSRSE